MQKGATAMACGGRWICKLERMRNDDPGGRQICKVVMVPGGGVERRKLRWLIRGAGWLPARL
jgi:hypothetical protein